MSKSTFVTQEQCEKLDIFKKRGTEAAITDFAIALGGFVNNYYNVDSDSFSLFSLKDRTGYYWTKSDVGDNKAVKVCSDGKIANTYVSTMRGGGRPVCAFSSINTIPTNGVSGKLETDEDGVKFVYDGYYPQTAPEKDIQAELNRLFGDAEWNRNNRIPEVCEVPDINKFTYRKMGNYRYKTMKYKKIDGYRYNGKIYVRMELKQDAQLSNGEWYSSGDSVWFEVEPIKRLISEQDKITITEKIIFAGIPFNFTSDYKTVNFEETEIYKFTNEIWARDVERLKTIVKEEHKVELEISDAQTRNNRELRLQNSNLDKNREAIDTKIIQSGNDSGKPSLIRSQSGISYSNYTDDERAKAKYYIEEIKKINPELAEKYYGEYKKIIENAYSDLKIQQDVKNKLDDLIQELREFYNKNIFGSKYVDKINYTINAYKKNASQITIDEMLEKLNKYRMGIFKLIEYASDRDEINEKFAELQAICMTIYYKYYTSEENQKYFKDIKPENTSESICLINFLKSLEIDDNYFNYIIKNIDIEDVTKNADLFYNTKLWDIIADYYDIIEIVDAEVVTENQYHTDVMVRNNQSNSLVNKIIGVFKNFIGLFSRKKAKTVIESVVIEEKTDSEESVAIEDQRSVLDQLIDIYKTEGALEFFRILDEKLGDLEFTDELYKKYEERLLIEEQRRIPEDVNKFELNSPEHMWAALFEMVSYEDEQNPDRIVFIDKDGQESCIMLKDEPFLTPNGEVRQKIECSISKNPIEFELIMSKGVKFDRYDGIKRVIQLYIYDIHCLHFICEIDKLFGTHCMDDYRDELMNSITKDNDGKNVRYRLEMPGYAIKCFINAKHTLSTLLKSINIEIIRLKLRIARNDYYKDVCSQKKDIFKANLRIDTKLIPEDIGENTDKTYYLRGQSYECI